MSGEGREGVWEVERDRSGVMFSGPLEVGECRKVISVEEANRRIRSAYDAGYEDGKGAGEDRR